MYKGCKKIHHQQTCSIRNVKGSSSGKHERKKGKKRNMEQIENKWPNDRLKPNYVNNHLNINC